MEEDNWKHRSSSMKCSTCMYYVPKLVQRVATKKDSITSVESILGRCRRSAPTIKGYPVVFNTDWCGEHKLDENKVG